jgi:hypothetical protein
MFSKFLIAFTILNKTALKSKSRRPVKCVPYHHCMGMSSGSGWRRCCDQSTDVMKCHREPRNWGRVLRTTSETDNVHGIWYKKYSRLCASGDRRILTGGQFPTEEMGEEYPKRFTLTQLVIRNN